MIRFLYLAIFLIVGIMFSLVGRTPSVLQPEKLTLKQHHTLILRNKETSDALNH